MKFPVVFQPIFRAICWCNKNIISALENGWLEDYFPFRFRPIFRGDVLVGGYLLQKMPWSIATRRRSYFWIRCHPCDAGSCGRMKFPPISSLNAQPTNGTGEQWYKWSYQAKLVPARLRYVLERIVFQHLFLRCYLSFSACFNERTDLQGTTISLILESSLGPCRTWMLAVYATYRCKDEQRPGSNLLTQLKQKHLANHVHLGMLQPHAAITAI